MRSEIYIYDLQDRQITNSKTGEVTDYVNVSYITEQSGRKLALSCYVPAKFKEILKKYYERKSVAELDVKLADNNTFKLRIVSINSEKLR